METTETIKRIASSSGKADEEVKNLVEKKMGKFSGLLTESGAAIMVAKELGIDLMLEKQALERLKIGQLKDGMNNVELLVRAMQIFQPKPFEKNGRKGIMCKLIVADSSGEIRLTVWGKDVEKLQNEKVEKGSILLLKNCFVNSYKERLELNLSYNGEIILNQKIDETELPAWGEKTIELGQLGKGEGNASVIARILQIFPEKEFARENGKGKLVNFLLGDSTATVRATAWDEMVEEVKKLKQGQVIKIEGAYTKEGLKGIDLQLGWKARILQNPKGSEKVPGIEAIKGIDVKEKNIAALEEADRFVQLNAEIADILSGNLRFNVCPNCGKKVDSMEGSYLCDACGEIKPDIRAVVSLKLRDETGEIKASFFGELAEKVIGLDTKELKKRLEVNTAEQLIAEARERIVGKKAKVNGYPKNNSFSGELEFSAKGIEISK